MKNILLRNKIKLKIGDSWHLFNPGSILFFNAKEYDVCMVTYNDGHTLDVALSLQKLEEHFNAFFKINKTYLINLEYLNNISDLEDGFVLIDNRYKIPIDRDKKLLLYEALSKLS